MLQLPNYLRTTAFRLSLAIAAFFTSSSLIVSAFVYWQTVLYASNEVDHEVAQIATAIQSIPPVYVERRLKRWLAEQPRVERYGLLLDANGATLAGNMDRMPDGVIFDGQARTLHTKGLDGNPEHEDEIVRAIAMRISGDRSLLVAIDTDEWENFRDAVLRALAIGLVPTAILGCLGGALFGRSIMGRLSAMDASIGRIIRGDLSERLPQGSNGRLDEFDLLASRVNLMLDDLQRLILEVQVVGDSIAHDLRTPLTRLLTRLEIERDKAQTVDELRTVIDEAAHWLQQTLGIITAVLRIGEIEHGRRRAAFHLFNGADLVREVHDLMAPLAEDKDLKFGLAVDDEPAPILGDRDLMLEALVNIVDNAIKFTPLGGSCCLKLSRSADEIVFRLEDTGPGIPASERKAVLGRFYKTGAHRNAEGTGLGLALVAAVARLHDFNLKIDDNEPGCVVEIRAPVGSPPRHPTPVPMPIRAEVPAGR